MKRWLLLILLTLTSCGPLVKQDEPVLSNVDVLANLPTPNCDAGPTPADQEGPYYKTDTPERTSLLEEGMQGKKLILVGYVLDKNCLPMPGAWLDFWQADSGGSYDNEGYTLRGHQFTDNKGRYYLETIMPGPYPQRPIEHIHVKLQASNSGEFTTQLYFPSNPVDGLTVLLEDKGDYFIAYFNFITQ